MTTSVSLDTARTLDDRFRFRLRADDGPAPRPHRAMPDDARRHYANRHFAVQPPGPPGPPPAAPPRHYATRHFAVQPPAPRPQGGPPAGGPPVRLAIPGCVCG